MLKSQLKQVERDPFQCTCGPCKSFWKKTFQGPGELLYRSALSRAAETSVFLDATIRREDHPAVLRLGDRVVVKGEHNGTVKFVGVLQENRIAPATYVGVHLDENIGSNHNGVYNGKRYFHCPRGHGAMVKYSDVMRCNPPEKRPPTRGNYMFPSFSEVRTRRKEQQERSERTDLPGLVPPQADTKNQEKNTLFKKESRKFVFDKDDIAVKDAMRREQEERTRVQRAIANQQRQEEAAMHSNMQQWKEKFGNNDQAERMANALRKLHAGYARGQALRRRQELGIMSDSDQDEDSDDDMHFKI